MSGSLAGLALGAASLAASALTDTGYMLLGPLIFTDFALPERVGHGGSQALTVHKLPGGARIIDVMGQDPADITWSGMFLGLFAQDAAQQLDALWRAGQPLDLFWNTTLLTVVIRECTLEDRFMQTDYRLTCTVLPDILVAGSPDPGQADGSAGDGTPPATPDEAQQQGNAGLTRAAAASTPPAATLPVPPIPPAVVPPQP